MNERIANKPVRRKLSHAQVIEILERNVSLYKEEENFVHYLVELALYLLEYEYDWSQSGSALPDFLSGSSQDLPAHQLVENRDGKMVHKKIEPGSRLSKSHNCPFCGVDVGDLLVCPSCRNLTR